MQIEFSNCLLEILETERENWPAEVTAVDNSRSMHRVLERFADIPSGIVADFAHAGAFEWAKILRRIGIHRSPLEIAEGWRDKVLKRYPQYFQVEIGATGFLNVLVTPQFRSDFFASLGRDPTNRMFSRQPVVTGSKESFFAKETFLCRPFRWDLILDRARRLHGVDISELQRCSDEKRVPERDIELMLLGLAIHPELDLTAFGQGWGSFENLPWMWLRFLQDSRKFCLGVNDQTWNLQSDDSRGNHSAPKLSVNSPLGSILVSAIADLEQHLLSWRFILLEADRLFRPELLVGSLSASIRVFYRIYNHPASRVPSQYPSLRQYWMELAALVHLLESLVSEIPQGLRFSTPRAFHMLNT